MDDFEMHMTRLRNMHYDVRLLAMEMLKELRHLDEEHGVFCMDRFEKRAKELGLDER